MAIEELNAWGRYEETAKGARVLARRRATVAESLHRDKPFQQDVALERASDGVIPTLDWLRYFDKDSVNFAAASIETDDSSVTDAPLILTEKIANDLRWLFGVYFKGSSWKEAQPEKVSCGTSLWNSVSGTMAWSQPYIEGKMRCPLLFLFIELCLRGIAQVYFQNNPLTGLFILVGLFLQSSRVAVHGIAAIAGGNLLAMGFGFDKGLIRSGLFGYNAVLVGLAIGTFAAPEKHTNYKADAMVGSIIFACFSSVLFVMLGKVLVPYKSPPLTLPFNFATILFLAATAEMSRVDFDSVRDPSLPHYNQVATTETISARSFFEGVIRGIGQVYLVNDLAACVVIWIGLAFCSRIGAISAFIGSLLGAVSALATGASSTSIANGMYGFNASLTFAAILMFYAPTKRAIVMGVFAAILTVAGQQALSTVLAPFGLPFMTLPFCMVALPFIVLQGTTTFVVAVPLATMTIPEDHLHRLKILKDGFGFLKSAIALEGDGGRFKMSRKMTSLLKSVTDTLTESDLEANKKGRTGVKGVEAETAKRVFAVLDRNNSGHLSAYTFIMTLQKAGLTDREGVQFASIVFNLMDLDRSNSMEENEFIALCIVSRLVQGIRQRIAKFFFFVDADSNAMIDLDEIDNALEYLGESSLSQDDRTTLVRMTRLESEEDEIDLVEMINFVTISKLKALVKHYHDSQRKGEGA